MTVAGTDVSDFKLKRPVDQAPSDTISIGQILDAYNSWGVPHFQRGSVWGPDNVSALLESLYHDTPCGSIILWTPEDAGRHGVPLVAAHPFSHLIIDGQQRTRSVYAAFKGLFVRTDGVVDEADDAGGNLNPQDGAARYWAINLNEVPACAALLRGPQKRQFPLFVLISDPCVAEGNRLKKEQAAKALAKSRWRVPESPFKYNFVPLHYFNHPDFESLLQEGRLFLKPRDGGNVWTNQADLQAVILALDHLRQKVQDMKTRRLFQKVLGKDITLDTALRVFIRINSGGRPVQEEEKGFSILVGKCDATAEWVARIFKWVRVDSLPSPKPPALEHDEALARMNERSFGFKLFIRVFIMTVTYHAARAIGARGLSFAMLRDRRFLSALEGDQASYERLWIVTADTVVAMRQLMRAQLKLDAIRFLPDTASLLPLFLCLIKYPGLMTGTGTERAAIRPEFEAGLARLALALLLKDPAKQQIMKWAAMVVTTHQDAAVIIDRLQYEVTVDQSLLQKVLRRANSLTNRYTLLLYALERSRNAKDFHYKTNRLTGPKFRQVERLLADQWEPQKQHIVPYSHLLDVYSLESKYRASSTEANNIGNITYISRAENSLEGLSDKLAELAGEPLDNLKRHFVNEDALAAYNIVKTLLNATNDTRPDGLGKSYKAWIQLRRRIIAAGFLEWLGALQQEWSDAAPGRQLHGRIDQVRPSCAGDRDPGALAFMLRTLGLPDRIEDALIQLFMTGHWKVTPNEHPDPEPDRTLTLSLQRKSQRVVRDVKISPRRLIVPGDDRQAEQLIELTDTDVVLERLRELSGYFQKRLPDAGRGKKRNDSSVVKPPTVEPRPTITLERLLDDIGHADPAARQTAEALLELAREPGGRIERRSAAASIRVRNAVTRRPCTLFVVTCRATFYIGFLRGWEKNAQVDHDLGLAYDRELTEILRRSPRMARGDPAGNSATPLVDIARHLDDIVAVVRRYAARLRGVAPAAAA